MQRSQIPDDHDVKMRYIFYSLDPEENYNVQVLPGAAISSLTPTIDNLQKGEIRKLSQLTRSAITSVWNSVNIGTDSRARFMNFRDYEVALSAIFVLSIASAAILDLPTKPSGGTSVVPISVLIKKPTSVPLALASRSRNSPSSVLAALASNRILSMFSALAICLALPIMLNLLKL